MDAVFVDTSEFQFIPFSVCGNTIHFYMALYVNLFSTSNICVSADRAKMKGLLCKYETYHYVPLEILENTVEKTEVEMPILTAWSVNYPYQ